MIDPRILRNTGIQDIFAHPEPKSVVRPSQQRWWFIHIRIRNIVVLRWGGWLFLYSPSQYCWGCCWGCCFSGFAGWFALWWLVGYYGLQISYGSIILQWLFRFVVVSSRSFFHGDVIKWSGCCLDGWLFLCQRHSGDFGKEGYTRGRFQVVQYLVTTRFARNGFPDAI